MRPVILGLSLAPTLAQSPLGNRLAGLERLKDFETRRATSSDPDWRNGNADARSIQPGTTLTLAELEGPGIITHIWFTIAHEAPFYSRLLTLRFYWDEESHPSVECPAGDFFGIGPGVDKPFMSLPIRVTSDGKARNCYWPMPFRKKARLTVSNESDQPWRAFSYSIDWQKHKQLPEDTACFRAMYRQEYPCVMGRNYLIADIVGRGHYVGTIQSVYHASPGWYGEGDDFFFIDGPDEPQLRGTGTEDYFCDAWGFRQQDGPFYGTPLWEGSNTGDRGTAYRFHIVDPITCTRSLRVEIEHKGSQIFPDGTQTSFIERDDLMSSVALWYQTEPHKPWPPLPTGPERLPFREQALAVGYKQVQAARHSGAPLEVQALGCVTDGRQLWFRATAAGAWVEVPLSLSNDLTAELWLRVVHARDYGTWRVRLDSRDLGTFALYNANITPSAHRLGMQGLTAGPHTLRFECVAKSERSTGYLLGFDVLTARSPAYVRPPGFDPRKIQK